MISRSVAAILAALVRLFRRQPAPCPARWEEIGISDCPYGCKVYQCPDCHKIELRHSANGCPVGRSVSKG